MRPLPFVWPYWLTYWTVVVWAFSPEFRIVRKARKPATHSDSPDAGSFRVIIWGMSAAIAIAYPLAWVPFLRLPAAWQPVVFAIGIVMMIAGSLLRRHCWRLLGASFTGDVRAAPGQSIVTTGAYALVRHPSYSAGILMNASIGVALGSWGQYAPAAARIICDLSLSHRRRGTGPARGDRGAVPGVHTNAAASHPIRLLNHPVTSDTWMTARPMSPMFGEAGRHTRTALGASLPYGCAVEVDAEFEVG